MTVATVTRSEFTKFFSTSLWWVLGLVLVVYIASTAGALAFVFGAVSNGTLPGDGAPVPTEGVAPLLYSLAASVGYVIHDGELASPFPQGDPRGDAFTEEHVLFGSRDLFRSTFGLHYEINETWGAELLYEHLSHGQILGNGRNQGIDNIGLRATYAFGN